MRLFLTGTAVPMNSQCPQRAPGPTGSGILPTLLPRTHTLMLEHTFRILYMMCMEAWRKSRFTLAGPHHPGLQGHPWLWETCKNQGTTRAMSPGTAERAPKLPGAGRGRTYGSPEVRPGRKFQLHISQAPKSRALRTKQERGVWEKAPYPLLSLQCTHFTLNGADPSSCHDAGQHQACEDVKILRGISDRYSVAYCHHHYSMCLVPSLANPEEQDRVPHQTSDLHYSEEPALEPSTVA